MKENVQDLEGSGDFIDALHPVSFSWKEEFGGGNDQGFIAHEFQVVCPKAVQGEKDGPEMQGMQAGASQVIANIVAELQSLRRRVAELESTE